jgi:hypothetical protein
VAGQRKPNKGSKLCWDRTSSEIKCFQATDDQWKRFAAGWAAGVRHSATPLPLSPAIYANKSEYAHFIKGKIGLPVIVAIDPVLGKAIRGPHIAGYAAYTDPGTAPCPDAKAYIDHVEKWGGISSIQFSDIVKGKRVNTVYCKP